MKVLIIGLAFAALVVQASAQTARPVGSPALSDPIELPFWLEEGRSAKDDTRIRSVDDHPCGAVASLSVTRIPENNVAISTDFYVEFSETGKTLNTWRAPVDFVIAEVRGNQVGITNNAGTSLWIDTSGGIELRGARLDSPQMEIECPPLEPFKGSGHTWCFSTPDATTKKLRHIAWQGVCT